MEINDISEFAFKFCLSSSFFFFLISGIKFQYFKSVCFTFLKL